MLKFVFANRVVFTLVSTVALLFGSLQMASGEPDWLGDCYDEEENGASAPEVRMYQKCGNLRDCDPALAYSCRSASGTCPDPDGHLPIEGRDRRAIQIGDCIVGGVDDKCLFCWDDDAMICNVIYSYRERTGSNCTKRCSVPNLEWTASSSVCRP